VFTTVGFLYVTVAAILADGAITVLADPHVNAVGFDIAIPPWNKLAGVYGVGTNMIDLEMYSPSLRRLTYERISPVETGVDFPTDGNPDGFFHDRFERPRELVRSEYLEAHLPAGSILAAGVNAIAIVWLSDGITPIPSGPIFSVAGVCAAVGVANAWSNTNIVLDEDLPAGRYAVVGMHYWEATAIAARLVFAEGGPRPGCLGVVDGNSQGLSRLRAGRAGLWGEFEHDVIPTIDTLSEAVAAVGNLTLDLVQVRAGR